jgi:hypothetical protein
MKEKTKEGIKKDRESVRERRTAILEKEKKDIKREKQRRKIKKTPGSYKLIGLYTLHEVLGVINYYTVFLKIW